MLKLPVLIEHFREHRTEEKDISFLDYIQLHYFSGHPRDKDFDRDMQLPFRENDVVIIYSTVVVPEDYTIEVVPAIYKEIQYPLLDITMLPLCHAFGIWQPPKAC